MKSHKSLKKTK